MGTWCSWPGFSLLDRRRDHNTSNREPGRSELRRHDAVRWKFNWPIRGVEDLMIRRKHQDRFNALAVVSRLVMAHVTFREHKIIGHCEPNQRRAGAGRIECSEAFMDA